MASCAILLSLVASPSLNPLKPHKAFAADTLPVLQSPQEKKQGAVIQPFAPASPEAVKPVETSAKPTLPAAKPTEAKLAQPTPLPVAGKTRPASKTGQSQSRLMEYDAETAVFKATIEAPEWQAALPDRRVFAAFARHYTNRIHCEGVITDVLFPTGKGLELEIKNEGHDVFMRIANDVPPEFVNYPIDLNIICDGEVFQLNGIVDAKYAATNVRLLGQGKRSKTKGGGTSAPADLKPYAEVIKAAAALPHEEKLVRIVKRILTDKTMDFWTVRPMGVRHTAYGSPATLRQVVTTNINGIKVWDFAVGNKELSAHELLTALSPVIDGKVLAVSRKPYANTQRVLVLTEPKSKGF